MHQNVILIIKTIMISFCHIRMFKEKIHIFNNDKYYGIQHGLKKDIEPHVDISATYLCFQDDAKSQSTKTWFNVGIFPFDGRAITCGYLEDKTPCHTLFDTGASKAIMNMKFYDEHPIPHHYPKYPINVKPIQVANDQLMTVKEAIKFFDFFWRSYI